MITSLLVSATLLGAEPSFQLEAQRLHIALDDVRVATYVWADEEIPRPYFCGVTAPDGTQITRTHPPHPDRDKDNDDHATFHPGIWLAFGDIGGLDTWRLKARVQHLEFTSPPKVEDGALRFAVRNAYESSEGSGRTCEEVCEYLIKPDAEGYFLCSRSTFTTESGTTFGDQEEMGLGLRLATGLTVKHGEGALLNSAGEHNEEGTWGKQADWLMGSNRLEDKLTGAIVMRGPETKRVVRFHSRDYGLIVANPFGAKWHAGPDDPKVDPVQVMLPDGEELVLEFGVYLFSTEANDIKPDKKYEHYLKLAESLE